MCEKRTHRLKKGSNIIRLREARRRQRINRMTPSPTTDDHSNIQAKPQLLPIDKTVQKKVIFELALKTVTLIKKNKIIQQKIIDLQKETSEFVAVLKKSPETKENRIRYINILRLQATTAARAHDLSLESKHSENLFKMEPDIPN